MGRHMNTRWFALYIRRRRDHAENLTAEQHRLLQEAAKGFDLLIADFDLEAD
jgi:hypothetical protein